MTRRKLILFLSGFFCLFLLAGSIFPAFASGDEYKKGDEVTVDIYGDGKKVCNGIVEEVYRYPSGTFYSVIWNCGDGYSRSNTGVVPLDRLRPRGGGGEAKKPPVEKDNSNPARNDDTNRKPEVTRDDGDRESDSETTVSTEDLDYFYGKWKLSRFGGGSEVERDGKIYRETLLYVAKAAPITINADSTYVWIVRDGSTVKGKWRKLKPEEDVLTGGKNGLVLLKGFDGVDWKVSFTGVQNGKESIKIYSSLGNFDGERIGANKGDPAWNKVQFSAGEQVVVTVPGGEQCNAEIDKPARDYTGTVTYYVYYTCRTGGRTSGSFPAHKIRRR
ncbi:MAG: hypothetical protein ACR2G4_12175 [Pyrinomonadaceae bacterium]